MPELFSDPVYWVGEINPESFRRVTKELRAKKGNPVLIIDSSGGFLGVAFRFGDFVRKNGIRITGIARGTVDSAALLVYLACTRLLAESSATFLLHGSSIAAEDLGAIRPQGSFNAADLGRVKKRLESLDLRYASAVSWASRKISEEDVLGLMRGQMVLSAQEALTLGIVHEII